MKYMKSYKSPGSESCEITKDEARKTLEGYWNKEALNDIFDNDKLFRLYTPFCIVTTISDEGLIPMPGFFGVSDW